MKRFSKDTVLIILLSAAFFLAGCRTLDHKTPHKQWVPPRWEKTTKKKDLTWESIRKKKPDSSKPLTLAELLEIAVHNNPGLRQAWQEARVARGESKQLVSDVYPKATGTAKIERARTIGRNKPKDDLNEMTYSPEIDVTYLILDMGGRSAAIKEAAQTIIEANFQFNQKFQDLLLNVSESYYGLYSAKSALEAAGANVENAKLAYESADQKFKVGLVSKLDALQGKAVYDNSLYYFEEAKGDYKTAKATLAQALGYPADTEFEIVAPEEATSVHIDEMNVSILIDEALSKRPDIAALKASVRVKEAAAKSAFSDLFPTVNFGGTLGTTWFQYYGPNKTTYDYDYGWSGYFSLNWDIFDGFYNIGEMDQARAEMEAEREKLAQAEIDASADVWTKYYAWNTAAQKIVYSKAYLETSEASYELALDSYRAGLKSMLDLLDSYSNLSDARSQYIDSKKDLFFALVELNHSIGSLSAE